MIRAALKGLRRDTRGAAALEFALVSLAFFPLCIGLAELGVLLWTQNVLQSTANLTARCVAISSPSCTTPATFAVNNATTWLNGGTLTSAGVSVQKNASCSTAPGSFVKVTLSVSALSNMPQPLSNLTLSANACYPMSP